MAKWLLKRIVKVLIPFLFSFLYDNLILFCLNRDEFNFRIFIKNLVTLTMPNTTTWYIKEQLIFYVILFAAFWLGKLSVRLLKLDLSFLVLIIAAGSFLYWASWRIPQYMWYNTLSFLFGILIARNKEIINKISFQARKTGLITTSVVLVMLYYEITMNAKDEKVIFCYLVVCLETVLLVMTCSIKSKLLVACGKMSIEIYLVHIGLVNTVVALNPNILGVAFMVILTFIGAVLVYLGTSFLQNRIFYKRVGENEKASYNL